MLKAKDAKKPLNFKITRTQAVIAKCGDPEQCVIAQAVRAALGDLFDTVEVGASITKVYTPTTVIRYRTPAKLRLALLHFDKTGSWNLPEGDYHLAAPTKVDQLGGRKNRWHVKPNGNGKPGKKKFRAAAMPTRKVSRAVSE